MRILALSPHTDDCEIACGGTIAKFVEKGNTVTLVAFSTIFDAGDLSEEVTQAAEILGVKLELLGYPVRYFQNDRQGILDDMIRLEKLYDPNIVLLPSTYDTHQDHQVIREEAFRAFKKTSMWGYEVPHNNLSFTTSGFVVLKERHLLKKIEAIKIYDSQNNRNYTKPEFIRSLAKVRGEQIGVPFAEVFEIIRSIT